MQGLVGQDIDHYHIIEQLGQGGMAIVYKAYDTRLERDVAVKVIRRNAFSPDVLERVLKRFDREAKSLAKLTHPNIVSIIDYGEFQGNPYLVMPFLVGGTLKQLLGKPIPWQEAIALLLPIADALSYAHQKGIVHRDVKPSNILITEGGAPMLTDFGIARLLENEDSQTLTATGVGVGTPEYMSPEQGMGREVDGRSDVYALGIVLYEMVTGKKPYTADTPLAVLLKQVNEALPDPGSFAPNLPVDLKNVIYKAIAKNPENRYQSMGGVISALEKIKRNEILLSSIFHLDKAREKILPSDTDLLITVDQLESVNEKPNTKSPSESENNKDISSSRFFSRPLGKILGFSLGGVTITLLIIGGISGWFNIIGGLSSDEQGSSIAAETLISTETSQFNSTVPLSIDKTNNKALIGLSLPDLTNDRWKSDSELLIKLLEAKGYEVIVQDAYDDENLQNEQIVDMVSQGIKGLIVVAVNSDSIITTINRTAAYGVKVIVYGDHLIKTPSISAYLSFDNVEVGRQQALGVMTALGLPGSTIWTKDNPAKIVLSSGESSDNNSILLLKGQMEIVQPYIDEGIVEIVDSFWVDNWDPANALKNMENVLTAQQNEIDAVVASNDGTALGELTALKAQGLAGKVPISGQDATADGANSIVKGELTVTIYRDFRLLAPAAVDILDAVMRGNDIEGAQSISLKTFTGQDLTGDVACVFLPIIQITKENVYEEIVVSGFQSYEDVYHYIPEDQRPLKPGG